MFNPASFFDLADARFANVFLYDDVVWNTLPRIHDFILEQAKESRDILDNTRISSSAYLDGGPIIIGRNCVVEPGAYIRGPVLIGDNVTIRHGAYIRGDVIVDDDCLIGHATEVKNAIFLKGSKAPHFNYVGDSILGRQVNLGAGTRLSNLKMFGGNVHIRTNQIDTDTGLRKFGAIIGDDAETSCNVVLNPGTLLGKRSLIYPNCTVNGYVPDDTIVKLRQVIEHAARIAR